MKKVALLGLTALLLASCGSQASIQETPTVKQTQTNTPQTAELSSIAVAGSIVPVSSIVSTIGGDYVEVENIVPAGVSPHGFDLSAKQMANISKSEKVFMIGLEQIDGFLFNASDASTQVHLADGMELINLEEASHDEHKDEHEDESHDEHKEDVHHDEHEDEHNDEHEDEHNDEHEDEDDHIEEDTHDHHDHSSDAHVWMGKDNVIKIAQKVRDELSILLPSEAAYFSANTESFITNLEAEFTAFENKTSGKTAQEFIVFHDAYNYLMLSIGLDADLKKPFSENVLHDTGTAQLAKLSDEIQEHNITYAFSEPQFNSGNLEKLARENNLEIGILDPHGTNPGSGGYIENLRANLENLSKIYE